MDALRDVAPLPGSWSTPDVTSDVVDIDGVPVARVGLAARGPDGLEVTGAAAGPGEPPLTRAAFELFERAATLEALRDGRLVLPPEPEPERFRHARSNGVAAHTSRHEAEKRATWELCERDRVLRSWYGDVTPERLAVDRRDFPLAGGALYDVRAYRLPDDGSPAPSRGVEVVVAVLLPRRRGVPLALGFGARQDAEGAARAALGEALQCAAFLWDEPAPTDVPATGPTAFHHLDHYQYPPHHDRVRAWLDGEHRTHRGALDAAIRGLPVAPSSPHEGHDVVFDDLTPPWAPPHRHVVRARCPAMLPLVFGATPWSHRLPGALRVHPIA